VTNTSNNDSKDNPRRPLLPASRPRLPAEVTVAGQPRVRSARSRIRDSFALAGWVALDWLAYFLRRWGDRRFAMNDTEAYWWGWQITKTRGGLGRRYRDPRFDALAACTRCTGAGVRADAPCGPCLGTGRVSLGEVS
jgi:hypothetical protein